MSQNQFYYDQDPNATIIVQTMVPCSDKENTVRGSWQRFLFCLFYQDLNVTLIVQTIAPYAGRDNLILFVLFCF